LLNLLRAKDGRQQDFAQKQKWMREYEKEKCEKAMKKIQITSSGIKKALKKYEYPLSISEYIWNGFDAKATQINISLTSNSIGAISELRIISMVRTILGSDRAVGQ